MADRLMVTEDMFVNNRWVYLDTELDLSEMFNDERGEIANRFTHHPPKEGQEESYNAIRHTAMDMAICIRDLCPDCHERNIAMDALDAAVMFANAAIARS